ncbi:phosphate ABC transporter permease PstA [Halosegnis marinus]|uniref:Phosphate transport system permease protein PstA n=1 Tax=Halosegnis marinus TaxID=3034023 RepID=A0ABD5ZKZ5_9EURY|nr:phosphate ABC transporter permease PstA [Halosegnis sp. DT85]
MATDSAVVEGFGRVSRTAGTVFRYLLLAATLFGLVALTVLLVFVFNDAVQPFTADPGWHLTYFLTLVVPSLAVGGYLFARNRAALRTGLTTIGLLVVSLMFAGGVGMIFVDIVSPIVWFAYVLALAIPTAVVYGVRRAGLDLPFVARVGGAVLLYYLSLFGLPGPVGSLAGVPSVVPGVAGLVQSIPVLPVDWMLLTVAFVLPAAALVGRSARGRAGGRAGLVAGGAALAAAVVAAVAGPFVGVTSVPALVLVVVVGFPTATYVSGVARGPERAGLLVPGVLVGGALAGAVAVEALGFAGPASWVDWQFLTSAHSSTAENAGLYPAIGGSILLMITVAVLSFPLGVGAAVYLEEYAPDNRLTRLIDVNISNLAGVPSVVYGLLGLGVFIRYLGSPTGTVLVGGATLALLILPIVIISSREAIRSVPNDVRQASYGMGATRWQTVKNVVLPRAFPGILTGTILALGRAIGETAPLIMIGAPDVLFSLPTDLSSKVSAMPLQVFAWASLYAGPDFWQKAVPAGVVVLVSALLAMNSVAIALRNKYQQDN